MKQAIALVISFMLISGPLFAAQQEPLSKSVVESTNRTLAEVLSRARSGSLEPGDLARAETSLRIQFEHMEATGINDRMDTEIRSHRAQLESMRVTDEMVVRGLVAGHSVMTASEIRTTLEKSVAQIHKFLDEFETTGGMRGYEAKVLSYLHTRSLAAERQVGYRHIRCCGPSCAATEAEGGLLAAGFGVATLFGCVPCGAIGAGLLFGTALVQWLCV